MTIGQFLSIMTLIAGLIIVALSVRQLGRASSRTQRGHDADAAKMARSAAIAQIAAGLALPVLMYFAMGMMSDVADIKLF